jgi:hypothetical protein
MTSARELAERLRELPITDEEQAHIEKASAHLYKRCCRARGTSKHAFVAAQHDAMMRLRRRCQALEALAQPVPGAAKQDIEGAMAIRVEKLLCEKLGRTWAPTGISIVSLIDELAARVAGASGEVDEPCTDCGGTGVTYQTERPCACQAAQGDKALRDAPTADELWQELVEYDDRTSPEEYPDMALITRDELADFIARAAPQGDKALREAREAIEVERAKVSGDDGYNYAAGQEYGLRLALIKIDAVLSPSPDTTASGGGELAEHLRLKNELVLKAYPAMDAVDAIRRWCDEQEYENDLITVALLRKMLPAAGVKAALSDKEGAEAIARKVAVREAILGPMPKQSIILKRYNPHHPAMDMVEDAQGMWVKFSDVKVDFE